MPLDYSCFGLAGCCLANGNSAYCSHRIGLPSELEPAHSPAMGPTHSVFCTRHMFNTIFKDWMEGRLERHEMEHGVHCIFFAILPEGEGVNDSMVLCQSCASPLSMNSKQMIGAMWSGDVSVSQLLSVSMIYSSNVHQEKQHLLFFDMYFSPLFITYPALYYHFWMATFLNPWHSFYKYVLFSSFYLFLPFLTKKLGKGPKK